MEGCAASAAALLRPLNAAAQGTVPGSSEVAREVGDALRIVYLIAGVLLVLILLAVAFLIYRRIFRTVAPGVAGAGPDPAADPLAEAERELQRGNFIAAAGRFEAAGERTRAGECWEQVKDYARAAEAYEAGGDLSRAAAMHLRSGGSLRAAGIFMRTREYLEAAKIFRNKGDHLRAAQALELLGNKVAAAREYSAAGNHARAARLLEGERMYAEAAEAFRPLLGGGDVRPETADRYSTYAALLALSGDRGQAIGIYRRVLAVSPGHLRAESALRALLPRGEELAAAPAPDITPEEPMPEEPEAAAAPAHGPPPGPPAPAVPVAAPAGGGVEIDYGAEASEPLKRVFTLRSMIRAGRMEPRYSMRLWVQIMRSVAEAHRRNRVFGRLTPDAITIDMENNVRVEAAAGDGADYVAPEVQAGMAADRQSDIFAMGVILFELVTGSVEQLGRKRAGEIAPEVPPWLDELIARCTEKNRNLRYRTAEEISETLRKLMSSAQA